MPITVLKMLKVGADYLKIYNSVFQVIRNVIYKGVTL